ncbi:YjiH family protein [Natronolimnohabitans sp. A-GB9]|uniref:YjiH family protein n=1 Tax=Natronolimnohabitans sp. A-GB9 TaxID=3069757 RepID=UPI0027B3DFFA|nr:nucleoside recognition domain-containing protein [Natronolimnohabitans sp. A-GB9]MDQ2052451.1 YjiH family protein [Natronolimnohabitans sp. A-GB9]
MFGGQAWEDDEHISGESVTPEEKSIDDVDFIDKGWRATLKFIVAFATGAFVFLFPIQWDGQTTIPLDVMMTLLQNASMFAVEMFTLGLLIAGGVFTTIAELHYRRVYTVSERVEEWFELDYWRTSKPFWALRVIGAVLGVAILLEAGPGWMFADPVVGTAWSALAITVALVIPLGAIFVNLLAELGGLQFIGTLAQPLMRPFFNLPGRSALDSAASWLGSFSIGYYLTRNVFDRGGYNKREVFVICTCFATANLGTVGAVAAVLEILHLFPIIVALYLIATLIVAAILARIPPLSTVPEEYVAEPNPEPRFTGTVGDYFRFAFNEGVKTAKKGDSIARASVVGFIDGMKLAGMIIGTVLTIAMTVLLLEHYTAFFAYISAPFIPLMNILGIPDPQMAATGIIAGGAEYFIGATMVVEADVLTQVFVVIVTSGQAIFIAASAPMMVDMFDDVPMRFRDLLLLLVLRTAFLIPVAAALTHAAAYVGLI